MSKKHIGGCVRGGNGYRASRLNRNFERGRAKKTRGFHIMIVFVRWLFVVCREEMKMLCSSFAQAVVMLRLKLLLFGVFNLPIADVGSREVLIVSWGLRG
jgi:hypothetical protein